MEEILHNLLYEYWGYKNFRPLQLEAIKATIENQDCLLTLPTGGGKSITYQLPALYENKVTVVVSPLLALSRDQLQASLDRNIDASSWDGNTTERQRLTISRELLSDPGECSLRLLYTTPESLATPKLRELLDAAYKAGNLLSFAIDEAHCVSQWGHDYRPSYLALKDLRRAYATIPFMAVTATATKKVRASIVTALDLQQPLELSGGLDRPNLQWQVRCKEALEGEGNAIQDVIQLLRSPPITDSGRAIIYCRQRERCEWVARQLSGEGFDASAYHAGLSADRRARIQHKWSQAEPAVDENIPIIVATIAFGMGIDIPDCRLVIHFDPPCSLEGLYQEAGRAGRDGNASVCILYTSSEELKSVVRLTREAGTAVASYCHGSRCRRKTLLSHFGESSGACGAYGMDEGVQKCDVCLDRAKVIAMLETVEEKTRPAEALTQLEKEKARAAVAALAERSVNRSFVAKKLPVLRPSVKYCQDNTAAVDTETLPTRRIPWFVAHKKQRMFQPPRKQKEEN